MLARSSWLPVAAFLLPALATEIEMVARETSTAERFGQAIIPRAPEPTPPPPRPRWAAMGSNELFARASTGLDTCGYISGVSSYFPLTCGGDYTCTNSGHYRGCCESTDCTSSTMFFTTCYDSTACVSQSNGPNTLCCTYSSQYPYCITYLWSTTASPGQLFTEYNCDASQFSGQYFLSATSPTTSTTTSSTKTTSTSAAGATGSSTARSGSSSTTGAAAPTQTTSTPSGSGSGSSTGAIVGGVVGGVGGIAMVAFVAWFLIRRNNKKKDAAAAAAAAAQPPQPPMGQYPPPPQGPAGYVDPRYSYVPPPSTGGYPSPTGSPGAFTGYYNPKPEHEQWVATQQQQQQQGYMHPQPTGSTVLTKDGVSLHHPPTVTEVDAVNPLGTSGQRAELA
ncbi:hypothetical protein BX600DRAFT_518735 [Xylariales sp. PMI_506]|nr:hypothetical protein BX600DRAFT_518735 [Xylariales sp. PMI_506]